MSVQAQPDFEQSAGNTGADIIIPSGTSSAMFIGADTYFRCKDSANVVEHWLTTAGSRITCGVYNPR